MINFGVLIISDKGSRGLREDKSGDVIREGLSAIELMDALAHGGGIGHELIDATGGFTVPVPKIAQHRASGQSAPGRPDIEGP